MPRGIMDDTDAYVGNRMRQARILLGISQEKLGARLDLTFQQVQKYEKGINRIGAGRLWRIAKILDVPITYFFEGLEGDPAPDVMPTLPAVVLQFAIELSELPKTRQDDAMRVIRALRSTSEKAAA